MAEGLAFSIAENLIPKLTSIAVSEIGLIYNCYEDMKNLEDTLSMIKDVLLDAEELQEKSYFIRNRIKKLEQVLYDADDLLDDVATENLRRRNLDTKGKMARQVTTRDKKVAFAMGVDSPFLLKGLSDEQSLELFEKLAFKEGLEKVLHHKLKEIGKELVTRCEGVPLAIKTLGSAMRSKTSVSEWESIQKNKIWSLSSGNSSILSVLKLSYDQLPTHLKYCFSYSSIFPKDHKIQCEMLIQLWMAQGYVQSSERSETLEEIGIDYVKDFLSLSFFQEVEVDDYKIITSFKMHDLVHDLAIKVAASNCYFMGGNDAKNSNVERVHHVSLESRLGELPKRLLKEKGTRTFFIPVGWSGSRELSHLNITQRIIMSNFKCLRVLDLNNCGIKKMRSSIGLLTHLRYLDLSGNEWLKGLPKSISNLLNLQTLKLSYCCYMKKLPMGITKLINLRYLMIDGCEKLTHMPSGIDKLVLLQRLSKFVVVGKDKNKNKWGGRSSCGRLSELKGLNNLGGELRIENLGMVNRECPMFTSMPLHPNIKELELISVGKKLVRERLTTTSTSAEEEEEERKVDDDYHHHHHQMSSSSNIISSKLTSLRTQHLTSLENLTLEDCPELELSEDDDGIHWQCLRSLRKLKISKILKLVTLPVGIQHLTQLQQLKFSQCPNLASLPQEINCLTSLLQLQIDYCPKLSERCQKGTGEDWLNIAHIPNIKINFDMIQGTFFYL